jgi:DNA polymerase-3 subunit delta'
MACQQCHACRLIAGRTHPNFMLVEPEKAGQAIKVDQIREVTDFIQQSALNGDFRIVLITPANNMNDHAANALLKTLEEPTPGALILLLSEQHLQLPATIVSRCQLIKFNYPARDIALLWLREQLSDRNIDADLLLTIAHGAPLNAVKLAKGDALEMRKTVLQLLCDLSDLKANPISAATALQDVELLTLLDYLLDWSMDLLRVQLDGEAIVNRDFQSNLSILQKRISVKQGVAFLDYLQKLRQQLVEGINRNKQLVIEAILVRWHALFEVKHVSG